jgi:hypothetical protein
MSLIDQEIANLQSGDGGGLRLTPEQFKALRKAMASYALAALMDSEIAQEAEAICSEEDSDCE